MPAYSKNSNKAIFMRSENRTAKTSRTVKFTRHYTRHAEGSVLVEFGDTRVLCTASIQSGVPPFLKDKGQGWITAEYGMLPRSTHDRMQREAARGKQTGRTQEIQRLIGRALRTAIDLNILGENTITIDCDVIQADGGTRTAAITGGCVALYDAIQTFMQRGKIKENPFKQFVAAISVGICNSTPVLDLDYKEDSTAETDMNVVMTEQNQFIEIQGTAEKNAFTETELASMLALAKTGINELIQQQKQAVTE